MKNFLAILIFTFCVQFLNATGCSNQTISLTDGSKYSIQGVNLTQQYCKYQFNVDPYIVPTIRVIVNLTQNDFIEIRQPAAYRNFAIRYDKTYGFHTDNAYLGPATFTIELSLLDWSPNDEVFVIDIEVENVSPKDTVYFEVDELIASPMSSSSLKPSTQYKFTSTNTQPVSLKYIEYNIILSQYIYSVFIYEEGQYLGSLNDVINAQINNSPVTSKGNSLTIITALNSTLPSAFIILLTSPYDFGTSEIYAQPLKSLPTTVSKNLAANQSTAVYHLLGNVDNGFSTITNNYITGFSFSKTASSLDIFAGCLTKPDERYRIATVKNDEESLFVPLTIHSRCRTFVVRSGAVIVEMSNSANIDSSIFKVADGQKGVIMSSDVPEPSSTQYSSKYLLQAIDGENFNVIYDFAYFDTDKETSPSVTIENYQKQDDQTETFSADNVPTDVVVKSHSYQQMISYTVPAQSTGFLIRYSVEVSSAGSALTGFVFIAAILGAFLQL